MKLLLDTHIWLWSFLEPHRVSSEVARQLANQENERFLSAVSIWEAVVLMDKKRLRIELDFGKWFKMSKEDMNLIELPVTWEVAHELRLTQMGYRDPADRFLAATAKLYNLTLVTADARLMKVPGLTVLPNQ
ncbi:MAG: type II toxin-antitoxin system VapC family toxin [Candidatus Acidiferrum sp.]